MTWTTFHRDCSAPGAPENCEELMEMRKAISYRSDPNVSNPDYYREAFDYLWVTTEGLSRWAYEWATWHKGPIHEFLDYTTQPAGGETGMYSLLQGTTLTPLQSLGLARSGLEALVELVRTQGLPDSQRTAAEAEIYRRLTPGAAEPIRIAMTGDWGSGTRESGLVTKLMASETSPHWTMHLGDVYFTGNPEEIKHNILGVVPPGATKAVTWKHGSVGSLAFEGNHEMYSMGNGYFSSWLPTLGPKSPNSATPRGQKASYAAVENEFWRVIGLDTGYSTWDAVHETQSTLQPEQVMTWLRKVLGMANVKARKDKRGLIILGHHQYRSAFEKQFVDSAKQLSEFIDLDYPILWFWGHEHKLSIYDKGGITEAGLTAYGRCIGIGGYPTSHVPIPENARSNGLFAYDDRTWLLRKGPLGTYQQGFNGYAALTLRGHRVEVEYRTLQLNKNPKDENDINENATEVVIKETFAINPLSTRLEQTNFTILNPGIVKITNAAKAGSDLSDVGNGVSSYHMEEQLKSTEASPCHQKNAPKKRTQGKIHLRSDLVEKYHMEL